VKPDDQTSPAQSSGEASIRLERPAQLVAETSNTRPTDEGRDISESEDKSEGSSKELQDAPADFEIENPDEID
jgi:hypothetical protein